jgi:hypothetical protein
MVRLTSNCVVEMVKNKRKFFFFHFLYFILVKMPVRCNGSMRHIIYCFLLKFGDELIYIPDNITYFNSV